MSSRNCGVSNAGQNVGHVPCAIARRFTTPRTATEYSVWARAMVPDLLLIPGIGVRDEQLQRFLSTYSLK